MQHTDYMGMLDGKVEALGLFHQVEGVKELVGRALIWKGVIAERVFKKDLSMFFDSESGEINFMDRVYVEKRHMRRLFFKWAMSNGYFRRRFQNFIQLGCVINPYGERDTLRMSYSIDMPENRIFPFLDTFRFLDSEGVKNYIGVNPCIALDSSWGEYNYNEDLNTKIKGKEIIDLSKFVMSKTTNQYENL